MAQGALPFQYEAETAASGVTALGGFTWISSRAGCRNPEACPGRRGAGLARSSDDRGADRAEPGGRLEDLERLEQDAGFVQVMREVERRLLLRADRRALRTRWRKPRRRAVPSPSAMADWLARFHDAAAGQPRPPGSAIIPAMAEPVRALWQVRRCSGSSRRTGGWRWRPWTW